jgi:hypothetical protein
MRKNAMTTEWSAALAAQKARKAAQRADPRADVFLQNQHVRALIHTCQPRATIRRQRKPTTSKRESFLWQAREFCCTRSGLPHKRCVYTFLRDSSVITIQWSRKRKQWQAIGALTIGAHTHRTRPFYSMYFNYAALDAYEHSAKQYTVHDYTRDTMACGVGGIASYSQTAGLPLLHGDSHTGDKVITHGKPHDLPPLIAVHDDKRGQLHEQHIRLWAGIQDVPDTRDPKYIKRARNTTPYRHNYYRLTAAELRELENKD